MLRWKPNPNPTDRGRETVKRDYIFWVRVETETKLTKKERLAIEAVMRDLVEKRLKKHIVSKGTA